jgi:CDP-diglyceride synthetase
MTAVRRRSVLVAIGVPLLIALAGGFLGMCFPIAINELTHSESFHAHNLFWESIFGIGFYVAGFFDSCMPSRRVAMVGFVGWPFLAMLIVFFVTRRMLHSSSRSQMRWTAFFLLSVVVWLGDAAENYLSIHHVPLYWNLYATCY